MKILFRSPIPALILLLLAGCEMTPESSFTRKIRNVTPIENPDNAIAVKSDMKFYDGKPVSKTLKFPKGIYSLVLEDKEYFYYQSKKGIQLSYFRADNGYFDSKSFPGGIMICKQIFFEKDGDLYYKPPAVAYIKGETDDTKIAIWKLDKEFLRLRGFAWEKIKITPNQPTKASP